MVSLTPDQVESLAFKDSGLYSILLPLNHCLTSLALASLAWTIAIIFLQSTFQNGLQNTN